MKKNREDIFKKIVNEIDLIFSSLNIIYLTYYNSYRFSFQAYVNKIGISSRWIK